MRHLMNTMFISRIAHFLSLPVRSLASKQFLNINSLRDKKGARPRKIRIGRGEGSGRGKQSTRGMKGSGQRGTLPRVGDEGGQFPFYLKPPKMGRRSPDALNYAPLNLNKLTYLLESRNINPDTKITMDVLIRIGAVSSIKNGVVLLASGKEDFNKKIDIEVTKASPSAVSAIRMAGGSVKSVYMPDSILKSYSRYFKAHPFSTVDDFLKKLPEKTSTKMKKIMIMYNLSTPADFPPLQLMKIYSRYDLGGFMAYKSKPEFEFNPKSIPLLK